MRSEMKHLARWLLLLVLLSSCVQVQGPVEPPDCEASQADEEDPS